MSLIFFFLLFSYYYNIINIKKKGLKPFKNLIRNCKDKEYIYKNCKHCKKLLKLQTPYSRGVKEVKCPKCKQTFKMFVFKRNKIEMIKNIINK